VISRSIRYNDTNDNDTKGLLATNAYICKGDIFMVELSPEDIDKIANKVFTKIAESMMKKEGEPTPTPTPTCPEGMKFGCPNNDAFGCDIGVFVCTGKGFKCHPKYVGFERV
jgi:hypothetical protein